MPPRPPLASKSRSRPLSAIYIGSGSTPTSSPPSIPDLPEPPSPSTSHGSGLPSPPATNSTGSGSVGDSNSNSAGSLRQRSGGSRSNSSSEMSNGHDRLRNVKRNSQVFTDEEEEDVDNEEDNTARLSGRRRQSKTAHEEGTSALDRVRSLTQRNRMVLDKLSSISRLNSPAPTGSPAPPNNPRTPVSPPTASGSVSRSSVRPQSTSNPVPTPARRTEASHSGSETERESHYSLSHSYSSDDLAATPPSHPEIRAPFPIRERRISAPASPAKGRVQRDRDRGPSPGPSRTPRKRVSMAMSVDEGHRHAQGDDDRDVLTSALAAVASSRRSPGSGSGKKTRQPLPREFRDRRSPEEKPHGEPSTPHRNRNGYGRSSPSSPRTSRTNLQNETQVSPRRPGQARYSTVRELTRKHQTRWLSEDLSGPAEGDEEPSHHASGSGEVVGRRQGHRGGSSDTLLAGNGGRSLIGEGLRAAGLTKRRDPGDDLFGAELTAPGSPRRTKSTGNSSVVHGPSTPAPRFDPHTPVNNWLRRDERTTRSGGMVTRPGTSMAALHHDTQEILPPRTAPPGLRAYKSTYALNRESVMSPQAQQEFSDRAYSSPFASVRAASVAPAAIASPTANKDMNAEHRRLMMEALTMFESQLSRLPPMGQTTTNTIPGLFQNAQHLVHSLDKLNGMLKSGTNRALEAQIDAEVADVSAGIDLVELWRDVGADHRESLRMNDEVVRNMTGFLLGVGKVLREATSSKDPQHLRTVSLDESVGPRLTPDTGATHGGGRSSDGRKSRETRRSWDPREMREASLARLSSLERSHVRPASALLRGSATSSSEGRSVADAVDGTPQTVKVSTMAPSSSMRRLYLSREQRATPDIAPIQTNLHLTRRDSPDKFEPSPTPTSRTSQSALSERQRHFPAASVPPSLSTLPSESLLTRTVSTSSSDNSSSHRKVSANSTLTVRPEPSASTAFNSILKPSGATTSLTPATVSAERSPGEPPTSAYYRPNTDRGELSGSARAGPSGNVATLSRATLATARLRSASNASSAVDEEPPVRLEAAPVLSPMSGSETERPESWRRTIAARPRASLESAWEREREERNASRNATVAARKERRRTITEIFQR